MTEFSYPVPQDAVCHSYVLTITPVNVIGRGVSSSVSYIGTEAGMHAMRQLCSYSVNENVMDQRMLIIIVIGAMLGRS